MIRKEQEKLKKEKILCQLNLDLIENKIKQINQYQVPNRQNKFMNENNQNFNEEFVNLDTKGKTLPEIVSKTPQI